MIVETRDYLMRNIYMTALKGKLKTSGYQMNKATQ
jgi:hypothetical protein